MQGLYRIAVGGETYEYRNVITTAGRSNLLKAISGQRPGWASAIVVGVGNTTETANDTNLEFLVDGADITATVIDYVNEKLYFKASLPIESECLIYEFGCYASNTLSTQSSESGGGGILAMITSESPWTDTTGTHVVDTTHDRVGKDAIGYTLGASATGKGYITFVKDLSFIPADANIKLAYYTDDITDVVVRFKVDDSNYYESAAWPVTDGYHISSIAKSAFSTTGSPSWSLIQTLEFEADAGVSGGTVAFDAMRYELPLSEESELLSRVVIVTPQEKIPGVSLDIEYLLEL